MKTATTLQRALPALRAAGVAAALACTAGLASASGASVSIAWFGVSAEPYSGNYVLASNPYQSFNMVAADGGGAPASYSYDAPNWDQGLNSVAQTGNAQATGNTVTFTDPSTQLATGGFNLAASAQPVGVATNSATAAALQSGSFTLIDGYGDAVAGSITFDLYYDLGITHSAIGSSPTFSLADLGLVLSSSSGTRSFSDGLSSSLIPGGSGSTSGYFTWTINLAAGEYVSYALTASAAVAATAPVPEPSSYLLLGAGLGLVGLIARRRQAKTLA